MKISKYLEFLKKKMKIQMTYKACFKDLKIT